MCHLPFIRNATFINQPLAVGEWYSCCATAEPAGINSEDQAPGFVVAVKPAVEGGGNPGNFFVFLKWIYNPDT